MRRSTNALPGAQAVAFACAAPASVPGAIPGGRLAHVHLQLALEHEEQFILVRVVMPNERAVQSHEFGDAVVHLAHDVRVFGALDAPHGVCKVDLGEHAGSVDAQRVTAARGARSDACSPTWSGILRDGRLLRFEAFHQS